MNKFIVVVFCVSLIYVEYRVICKPETMLYPPKYGKKDYGPLPGYIANRMVKVTQSVATESSLLTKIDIDPKSQVLVPTKLDIMQEKTKFTEHSGDGDLDDDVYEDKEVDFITCVKRILGYTIFVGLELAIVGYFFIYRLYLDRLEMLRKCTEEQLLLDEESQLKRNRPKRKKTKKKIY